MMMLKFWNWYQNSLSVHPVKTQVITSGALWAVGDVTAQYITHSAAA
jgi:protein Mpv17